MATYRVILTGVRDGLDVSQVAPRLAIVCKIPVEGAMALLASPRMVIKRALSPETAGAYKTALQSVGCKALVEQETGANNTTASLIPQSADGHNRVAWNAQDVRQHLSALSKHVKRAVVAVAGLAQRVAARAGERTKSAKTVTGGSNLPFTAGSQSKAMGAQSLAATPRAKKPFLAIPVIIASVAVATVAIAGFFAVSGPAPGGPCPGEYDAARWTDCVGEVKFPNGEKYVGEVKDGQPNGHGTFTWPNGEKYVGEWKEGRRNGQGRFFWPDGAKYVGEFRNDKKQGQGTMTFANGRKYVGEFKDGNPKPQ